MSCHNRTLSRSVKKHSCFNGAPVVVDCASLFWWGHGWWTKNLTKLLRRQSCKSRERLTTPRSRLLSHQFSALDSRYSRCRGEMFLSSEGPPLRPIRTAKQNHTFAQLLPLFLTKRLRKIWLWHLLNVLKSVINNSLTRASVLVFKRTDQTCRRYRNTQIYLHFLLRQERFPQIQTRDSITASEMSISEALGCHQSEIVKSLNWHCTTRHSGRHLQFPRHTLSISLFPFRLAEL